MKKHDVETEAARMLKRDHKRITDLLFHFDQSEEPTHKLSFAETAINELAIHSVIEQECVYPLLHEQGKKTRKHVDHSRKEHEQIDEVLTKLVSRDQCDEEYCDMFEHLTKLVKKHIEEE